MVLTCAARAKLQAMNRRDFLNQFAKTGLLVTASPLILAGSADEYAFKGFHALSIYRSYVRGLQFRVLPEGYLSSLQPLTALDLLREPDNRHDRHAVAVYHDGTQLGYLPREDNLILSKLIRRGLPVVCRLIGVQPELESYQQLSIEIALLYPPHPSTDPAILAAEQDRMAGLAKVAKKSPAQRHESGDPLSAGHVASSYYFPHPTELSDDEELQRAFTIASYVGVMPKAKSLDE